MHIFANALGFGDCTYVDEEYAVVIKCIISIFIVWLLWFFTCLWRTKGQINEFSLKYPCKYGVATYALFFVFVYLNTYFTYEINLPINHFLIYLLAFSCQAPIIMFSASKNIFKAHLIEIIISASMTICLFVYLSKL